MSHCGDYYMLSGKIFVIWYKQGQLVEIQSLYNNNNMNLYFFKPLIVNRSKIWLMMEERKQEQKATGNSGLITHLLDHNVWTESYQFVIFHYSALQKYSYRFTVEQA